MTSQKKQHRVLVVDNNELVADSIVMVLLSAGFNAIAMYDPNRALAFAKNGTFDLLLTDVMMPSMSGIELAIQVQEGDYIARVLLMSGVPATADLLGDAHRLGYDFQILAKPMDSAELIDSVREVLGS